MAKVGPDLKRYMDKKLAIKLNGNRHITGARAPHRRATSSRRHAPLLTRSARRTGTLRGFDQFMNLVLDETVELVNATDRNEIGMVVLRGNSIVTVEALEKLWDYVPPPNR